MSKHTNGGKEFGVAVSKLSGVLAAISPFFVAVCRFVETKDFSALVDNLHHYPQVAAVVAAGGALWGVVAGNFGNPKTAKFDKAPAPDTDDEDE